MFGQRYAVERSLGVGGAGEVFLVADRLRDGRRLALKRLHAAHVARRGTDTITREFRLLASLQHPNLVEVHDLHLEPECFFTMEYVEGARLDEARLDDEQLVEVVVQLCRALDHVHRHGVVHQDVKPGNVLVRADGPLVAKLTDFGIASEGASVHGYTAGFVAPEVVEGRPFDARADLYALGRTLLAVAAPSTDDTSTIQLTRDKPSRIPVVAAAGLEVLPPRLAGVVDRLLRADPAERYGSAAQVIEALGAATGRVFALDTPAIRSRRVADSLVGREAELARLQDAWRAARDGRGAALVLVGASGLGKSQLVRRLVVTAQLDGGAAAVGVAGAGAWAPVAAVAAQLGGTSGLEERHAGELSRVLPGAGSVARPDELASDASRGRLVDALVAVVEGAARRRPVLVVVEDLQAADEGSLRVFRALAERIRAGELPRVLLLGTARVAPDLGVEGVVLEPLDEARAARLVENAVGPGVLPEAFVSAVAERSAGHTLFLGEVLRWLTDREVLTPTATGWACDAAALARLELPRDIDAVAAARIACLPADQARLLRLAALLGARFAWEHLATVGGPGVRADLVELVERGLLAADGTGYRFAHDRLHAVARADATAAPDAASASRALAEATEGRADPALVAGLWLGTSSPEKALPSLSMAARKAADAFDHAATVAHLDRALALRPGDAELHLGRLRAIARGGLGDADPRAAEALASAPDDAAWRALALELTRIALQRGAFGEARATAERALARGRGAPEDRAEAERLIGMASYNLGDLSAALGWLDRALATAVDPVARARILSDRGFVHGYAGRFAHALADAEGALALLGEGAHDALAKVRNDLGFACWMLGRYDDALRHLEAALELRQRLRDAWGEGVTRNNLGNVLRHRGDLEGARRAYAQAIALCHRSGNALYEAVALNNLGQCDEELDAFDAARERYERALELVRRLGDRIREGDNLGSLGVCALRAGRPDEARRWLEQAVAHRRAIADRAYLVLDLSFLAVARLTDDPDGAVRAIDEALAGVDEGIEQVQAVHLNAALVYRHLGRIDEARAAIGRAAALVEKRAEALDPAARERFLRQVRVNREIAALARVLG